jgi:hypothetical protein
MMVLKTAKAARAGNAAALGNVNVMAGSDPRVITETPSFPQHPIARIAIVDAGQIVAIVAGLDAARAFLRGALS